MIIPTALKIGGHNVTVQSDKEMTGENDGEWDSKKNTIRICSTLPESQKGSVLIHEIFHALNSTFGTSEMAHSLLDSFAEQFYQVLSDNNLLK